jgi:predicted Zn-dependent protease with MMP-like domain
VHEIGHHFGLSDADMAAIEDAVEHADGALL